MNRTFLSFLIIAIAVVAAATGWHLGSQRAAQAATSLAGQRKVLFYQSPMHPWIKSDRPGNCTICGMKLVPVFEGDAVPDETAGPVVKLSAQTVATIQVETTLIARQPLRRLIRVAGRIDDDDSAHRRLSAYVEGRIDKLFVNSIGAEVVAGQPLASLFSRELLVARSEYNLAAQRPASPERESALAGSRQKLRRFGLTAEQIEKLPGQTGDTFDIVAPITGTVVERKVYEGQYVKEGEVLFEIADFSKMWFVFDAYERDLAWIRVGQTVEVTTPSVPGKVFTAPVAFIDPNLAMETRTAKVRVILDNPLLADPGKHRRELLHKIFADGRIRVDTEPVLTVPRSAVLSPSGEPVVYVAKGVRGYEPRRITLGRAGDDFWEVLAGLQEGERVVTTGNLLVDAQAQLDQPSPVSASKAAAPFSDAQRAGAEKLFVAVSAVGEALAADDLAAHNAGIEALHNAAMAFEEPRLTAVAHVGPAKDLTAARKQFYPLSMAVAELALQWRQQGGGGSVKVFECPMAKSAVPSAETNQGRWVQVVGPLRNPFFGAEMLDCGKEIKP
ncbi:MAG: efflux RND transporter periplasmic adaptor subunit [Chthoniobacter sp.]|nr:efflux RND transporter periplasmic adaptor subunit [Chthoniobacter sp.]